MSFLLPGSFREAAANAWAAQARKISGSGVELEKNYGFPEEKEKTPPSKCSHVFKRCLQGTCCGGAGGTSSGFGLAKVLSGPLLYLSASAIGCACCLTVALRDQIMQCFKKCCCKHKKNDPPLLDSADKV